MANLARAPFGGVTALPEAVSLQRQGSTTRLGSNLAGRSLAACSPFLAGSKRLQGFAPGARHPLCAVLDLATMTDIVTGFLPGSSVGAAVELLSTEAAKQAGSQAGLAAVAGGASLPYLLGAPLALWYLTAAPGSAAGLVDLAIAPFANDKYKEFDPLTISVGKTLGEGSFGIVYEGWIADAPLSNVNRVPDGATHVVLKKVKSKVSGADEMREAELYMNQRLQRAAPGACAEYLGTVNVTKLNQRGKLTEGLWLVWSYQGEKTLDYYLKKRDFPANVAPEVLGPQRALVKGSSKQDVAARDAAVVREIMTQLLYNLRDLHKTGVVHRDVKPLNLVYAEDAQRFMLIDLGACVDLRTGHNYVPDETVMDPIYCAPEQYVMPTNMPSPPAAPLMTMLAPLVWAIHTPDRFDLYSAGLVFLQMCCPSMRQDSRVAAFNAALARESFDLDRWREKRCPFPESEFAMLDAFDGAGWDLLKQLLQDRSPVPVFGKNRPSAATALRHRYFGVQLQWATGTSLKSKDGSTREVATVSGSRGGRLPPKEALATRSQTESRSANTGLRGLLGNRQGLPETDVKPKNWAGVFGLLRMEAIEEVGVENVGEKKQGGWMGMALGGGKSAEQSEQERLQNLKKVLGAVGSALGAGGEVSGDEDGKRSTKDAVVEWTQGWVEKLTGVAARRAEQELAAAAAAATQPKRFSWTQAMVEKLNTQRSRDEQQSSVKLGFLQGLFGAMGGTKKDLDGATAATSAGSGTEDDEKKRSIRERETGRALGKGVSTLIALGAILGGAYAVAELVLDAAEGTTDTVNIAGPLLLAAGSGFAYFYVARPVVTQMSRKPRERPVLARPKAAATMVIDPTTVPKKSKVETKNATELAAAVSEMQAQLAALESAISEGRQFNQQQRALLAKMEKLLLPPAPAKGTVLEKKVPAKV